MKHNIWAVLSGLGVAAVGTLLVLISATPAWLKVQYVSACILLGMAVCYVGDRI